MIVVRDREAGNIIEIVESVGAGQKLIEEYEEEDKKDGTYEENFYEVAEVDIVICEHCKYYDKEKHFCSKLNALDVEKDMYCKRGERK